LVSFSFFKDGSTISLNALKGLNRIRRRLGIAKGCRVLGLTPVRALEAKVSKVPNPETLTALPSETPCPVGREQKMYVLRDHQEAQRINSFQNRQDAPIVLTSTMVSKIVLIIFSD
jgi:hypothetical protein